jgi:hypothetical protein
MSIVEVCGGPITHRYLMGKSKSDLAHAYMGLLGAYAGMKRRAETAEADVERLLVALELIAGEQGQFSMPWPEEQEGYGAFALMTARAALSHNRPEEKP